MKLRKAKIKDAGQVADVLVECYNMDSKGEAIESFKREFKQEKAFVVCVDNKKIVAIASWQMHDIPKHKLAELHRIAVLPEFRGKLDVIPIDEKYFLPPPMTFTIGMMKWAKDPEVAKNYIDFILSLEGQKHFENAGFIPAISDEGRRLAKKYGV